MGTGGWQWGMFCFFYVWIDHGFCINRKCSFSRMCLYVSSAFRVIVKNIPKNSLHITGNTTKYYKKYFFYCRKFVLTFPGICYIFPVMFFILPGILATVPKNAKLDSRKRWKNISGNSLLEYHFQKFCLFPDFWEYEKYYQVFSRRPVPVTPISAGNNLRFLDSVYKKYFWKYFGKLWGKTYSQIFFILLQKHSPIVP